MKIEIELSAVEEMRARIVDLEKTNESLKEKLDSLQENSLKESAIRLSKDLFRNYLQAVFIKLGFDELPQHEDVCEFENLEHCIGRDWYRHEDKIKVTLEASLSNHWQKAFLRIGVAPKKDWEDPIKLD